ncbi:hypothetical protein VFPPC_16826 [Pochonia chlamydosporia 170]|uniref:Uncharacterized protein n=1 Tax=Pochonia chlamydosporia 170 TaxID=1380566 RepID=A0A179F3L2_METCM|nr:hypothetical protein VFPPC_16826 [Pochonia chlamydosporia 170]OAQ60012.1 hypothetical protein VFPPC_16826 [Pochonia chlamydosporia 170]
MLRVSRRYPPIDRLPSKFPSTHLSTLQFDQMIADSWNLRKFKVFRSAAAE